MKKTSYVLGLASGVILAASWKFLVKESIKIGVKVGRGVKRVSAETLEDLQDANAEAMQEMAEQDEASRESDTPNVGRARGRKPTTV